MDGHLEHASDREYEITAWIPALGHLRRDIIERRQIEAQVRAWQSQGFAASTIRHRLSGLSTLYKELDGKHAYNPVAGVVRPVEPKPGPNAPPLESVLKVVGALRDGGSQKLMGAADVLDRAWSKR